MVEVKMGVDDGQHVTFVDLLTIERFDDRGDLGCVELVDDRVTDSRPRVDHNYSIARRDCETNDRAGAIGGPGVSVGQHHVAEFEAMHLGAWRHRPDPTHLKKWGRR